MKLCCTKIKFAQTPYCKNTCLIFDIWKTERSYPGKLSAEKLHRMALEVAEQLSEDDTELIIIGIEGAGKFGIEGTGKFIAAKVASHLQQYITVSYKNDCTSS